MASTYNQPTPEPTAKVAATGVGGALSIVLIYILSQFGIDLPAEVAASVAVLIAFASGYLVRERK